MLIRRLQTLLLLLLLGTGLSACLDSGDKKSGNEPITLGISLLYGSEKFIADMAETIKQQAKNNPAVSIVFKDAKGDIALQRRQIDELLADGIDGLFVNLPTNEYHDEAVKEQRHIVLASKVKDIPLIFYGTPPDFSILSIYQQAFYVSSENPALSAIIQAEVLIEKWAQHPEWDLNNDGVIQYALLKGNKGNYYTESRSQWIEPAIIAYPGANLRAERVAEAYADWNPDKAEQLVTQWLDASSGEQIEVVLSNNDEMALAAITAMKKQGMLLPTLGIDGTQEALRAIRSGELVGSVKNDPYTLAIIGYEQMLNVIYTDRDDEEANFLVRGHSLLPVSGYLPLTADNAEQYLKNGK